MRARAHCAADANPSAQTKPRPPLPGAERRLALAEDRAAARSCTDDLTFRSQRQRLSFLRRGVTPRPTSLESNYFQKLMEPGRPFRLAKLTACRKVGGMYRRYRPKSSRYGHKSAMAQAFPPLVRHSEQRKRRTNPAPEARTGLLRFARNDDSECGNDATPDLSRI
jgi:hypothetical protein